MVTGQKNVFNCAANFLRGRKCIFYGSFKVCKTRRGYAKCLLKSCGKQKSLKRLRKEIGILTGFYQLQPAYKLAHDLGVDYKTITRVYQQLRETLYHVAKLEGKKLSGEIEKVTTKEIFGSNLVLAGREVRASAPKSIAFPPTKSVDDALRRQRKSRSIS